MTYVPLQPQVKALPLGISGGPMQAAIAQNNQNLQKQVALNNLSGGRRKKRTKKHMRLRRRRYSRRHIVCHCRKCCQKRLKQPQIVQGVMKTSNASFQKRKKMRGGVINIPKMPVAFNEVGTGNQTVNGNVASGISTGANITVNSKFDACLGQPASTCSGK